MTFPCYMITNPRPTRDASQQNINPSVPSGKVNTGAKVSLSFNNWKIFSHDSDHLNLDFFWVKVINGDAINENASINLL